MDAKRRAELVARRRQAQILREYAYIRETVAECFFGDRVVPWFLLENREIGFEQHLFAQESQNLPSPHEWIENLWGWETVTWTWSRVKEQSNALTYPLKEISAEEIRDIDRLLEPVLAGDLCVVYSFSQTTPFCIRSSDWHHVIANTLLECAFCFLRHKAVIQCDPIRNLNDGYSLLAQRA